MSDLALPQKRLVDPPVADRWLVSAGLASLLVHAAFFVLILWSPPREAMEAKHPEAVEVELVEPEELQPPPAQQKAADETPSQGKPSEEKPDEDKPAQEKPAEASPSTEPPGGLPSQRPATPPPPTAETPSGAAEEPAAAKAAPSTVAPTPLPRRKTGEAPQEMPASSSGEPVAALRAEAEEAGGGVSSDALTSGSGPVALDLGAPRTAERFYLESMLQQPALARARQMLLSLPHDKRLSQTCNIEALAQIGNSGEGYAPDVVMTDAYAASVLTGSSLSASAAVFRSNNRWYGLGFDCTLSPDLNEVTSFTFRLGADVTDAVLARLGQR